MLIRLLVACSVVMLFAAGFFIGNYPVVSTAVVAAPTESPLPTIRLISADSNEVDVSAPQEPVNPITPITPITPVTPVTPVTPMAPVAQSGISAQDELLIDTDSAATVTLTSEPPATPEASVEEKAQFVANEQLLRELEHQLLTVSRLRDRVADLEWETLNLQSELLDNEVALANSQAELQDTLAAQPTIYNITNVPVGGSVITRPSATPVPSPNINTVQQPSPPIQASSGSTFFGPAPDRYENLINPSSAEPQNQGQDLSN